MLLAVAPAATVLREHHHVPLGHEALDEGEELLVEGVVEAAVHGHDRRVATARLHLHGLEEPGGDEVLLHVGDEHPLHPDAVPVALHEGQGHELLVDLVERVDQEIELGGRVLRIGIDERLELGFTDAPPGRRPRSRPGGAESGQWLGRLVSFLAPPVDHLTAQDGHVHLGCAQVVRRQGEDVLAQHHEIGQLPFLDRPLALFFVGGVGGVDRVGLDRLRARSASPRGASPPRACRPGSARVTAYWMFSRGERGVDSCSLKLPGQSETRLRRTPARIRDRQA